MKAEASCCLDILMSIHISSMLADVLRCGVKKSGMMTDNPYWGTGIRGLMRGMATLPKVTRSY